MENKQKDFLNGLNPSQLKAVKATEGRVRCCAGAGTGKTKTLVARFCYLIDQKGVSPSEMLCITFTNNAADEMRNRVKSALGVSVSKENISTIHSLCYRIVRMEGELIGWVTKDAFGNPVLNVADDNAVKEIADTVIEKFDLKNKGYKTVDLINEVNKYKNNVDYVGIHMATGKFNQNKPVEYFLSEQYKFKCLTFDDLLSFAHYLLRAYPSVLDRWQKFKYIQIDEVQDCSGVDWEIVNMLSEKYNNLFFVGDWNQAIYGFRGSDPKYMLEAKYDESYMLEKNYRSYQPILNLSNKSIEANQILENVVLEANRGEGYGILPLVRGFYNAFEEADWIGNKVKKLIEDGVSPNDIAILYRVNRLSGSIEHAMNGNGIPYTLLGGVRFYDRREISLIINILRVLLNNDYIAFSRATVSLISGFGRQSASNIIDKAIADNKKAMSVLQNLSKSDKKYAKKPVQEFVATMADVNKKIREKNKLSDIIQYIINAFKMEDYWKTEEVESTVANDRLENMSGLIDIARMFEENYEEGDTTVFPDFLETTHLRNDENDNDKETVKLMTVHKSKGMEFTHVFVAAVTEGVFPSNMSIKTGDEGSIEEERRLFYVACTRAKDRLYLTYSQYPYGKGSYGVPMKRSRFLNEVERCFLEEKEKKVYHKF